MHRSPDETAKRPEGQLAITTNLGDGAIDDSVDDGPPTSAFSRGATSAATEARIDWPPSRARLISRGGRQLGPDP